MPPCLTPFETVKKQDVDWPHLMHAILRQEPARDLRQHYIHHPLVKHVYAECRIQLVKLINILKQDENATILRKATEKTHSYSGFTFNVTRCFLNKYNPIYRIENCNVCRLQ